MIIQIRGTSGSGKSTVMRKVMDNLSHTYELEWWSHHIDGRKKPLYYSMSLPGFEIDVLGHYESPCGGGDTIGSSPKIYDLVNERYIHARVVIVEGLLLSEDTKWTIEYSKGMNIVPVFLTTPLHQCLARIRKRRREVGNTKPLNVYNTTNRYGVISRARTKLEDNGIECPACSSLEAPDLITSLIEQEVERVGPN